MGLDNQRAMGTDLLAAECPSAVAERNLGERPPDERPSPAARNPRRFPLLPDPRLFFGIEGFPVSGPKGNISTSDL
jgi:hypothetical protein